MGIRSDYHIHSTLSNDGRADLVSMVRACRAAGLSKVCFTEHIDIGIAGSDWTVDMDAYAGKIAEARAAFPDMKILMGLELGDTTASRERVLQESSRMQLDFKLLSRHLVDGKDPYDAQYFAGRTREMAARAYLEAIYRSVTLFPDYDALAHMGYVFKFVDPKKCPPLRYDDAPDLIDAVLRVLVQNGKALEYNTSRFDVFADGMPGRDVLARYRELGGELVTVGSDAHEEARTAKGFIEAAEALTELGFSYIATYEQRKLVMERI